MHPDVREIFHELRIHRDELARTVEKDKHMSEALTKATHDLAAASADLKATVDNAVTFIQSVPGLIANAIESAVNDADAVAAVQAVTAQLRAEGDAVVTAMRTPPPAPATEPAPPVDEQPAS
jgi:hypothetical protein